MKRILAPLLAGLMLAAPGAALAFDMSLPILTYPAPAPEAPTRGHFSPATAQLPQQ